MTINGLDISSDTTGHAHAIAAWFQDQGVDPTDAAIGIYLRSDRCSKAMIDGIHAVGMRVWSIWEKGYPTSSSYFTASQGTADGLAAAAFAASVGQPSGTWIEATLDYDSTPGDIAGCNLEYAIAFRAAIGSYGYHMAAYGNWELLNHLQQIGEISKTHLALSPGFEQHADGVQLASIVQLATVPVCGFDCDTNFIRDFGACW